MKRRQSKRKQAKRAKDSQTQAGRYDEPMRSWILVAILMIAIAVCVLVAHSLALSAQAKSFDDEEAITNNYLVQHPSWNSVGRFLTEVRRPSSMPGYYRPLTMISLMCDWAAGGRPDNLRAFHRTSLALHILNTLFVILLVYQLFRQAWVAGMVGLLFGLHPLTVEPIVWVMERKTLLAAFFGFCFLNLYVRYACKAGWQWYAGAWLMYVFALMSKPTSVPLPMVLLLLDYWPLRRLNWRSVWEKVPFFAIGGVFAAITVLCEGEVQDLTLPGEYSLAQLPLRICYLIVFYLSKIALPMHLSSVYPLPEPLALSNPVVVLSVLGTCALLVALVVSWRWTRALVVGSLIFFVTISPTLGFIGYSWVSASDKYVYLPSIGLLVVLGWLLGLCWGASSIVPRLWFRRIGVTVIVLLLAGAECIATRSYLLHWQDTEGLCLYMLQRTPRAPVVHLGLANALADRGELDDAVRHYREALQFMPNYAKAHANLALVLARQGKTDEAIAHCREALRLKPDYPKVHNNLGNFLVRQGRTDEAMQHFAEAVRFNPYSAKAHNNLGNILAMRDKLDEARKHFKEALRLDPNYAKAHCNLAGIMLARGEVDKAITHYREAVRLDPGLTAAQSGLAGALVRQGAAQESIEHSN